MTTYKATETSQWVSEAQLAQQLGFVRCEWLTAIHNGGESFEISLMVSNEDLSASLIISTHIEANIDSISKVYPNASFHEREVAQMFGVKFVGNSSNDPAFEIDLVGFPLRRDFALVTRVDTQWPGAVEPDETVKRRPSLPPGVSPEWSS